jgi:RNA polymerase-interacting CarD/CdnL/TRCF family regulator
MDNFNVGDVIVDFEGIYQIYDKKNNFFYYRPVEQKKQSTVSSIPVDNVSKSGFRAPLTKVEIKKFFEELNKKIDPSLLFEPKLTKEILYLNDPFKNIPIIKLLAQNKIDTIEKFARSNQETLDQIVNHLTQEFSYVTNKSPESVKKQIMSCL